MKTNPSSEVIEFLEKLAKKITNSTNSFHSPFVHHPDMFYEELKQAYQKGFEDGQLAKTSADETALKLLKLSQESAFLRKSFIEFSEQLNGFEKRLNGLEQNVTSCYGILGERTKKLAYFLVNYLSAPPDTFDF